MAIVGSIEDGISGNHDTLFAKAALDLVIVMVCVAFSAIPVAILQGIVTICAGFIAPIMNRQHYCKHPVHRLNAHILRGR